MEDIHLTVCLPDQRNLELAVSPASSVGDLKKLIDKCLGKSWSGNGSSVDCQQNSGEFFLVFAGNVLLDSTLLKVWSFEAQLFISVSRLACKIGGGQKLFFRMKMEERRFLRRFENRFLAEVKRVLNPKLTILCTFFEPFNRWSMGHPLRAGVAPWSAP